MLYHAYDCVGSIATIGCLMLISVPTHSEGHFQPLAGPEGWTSSVVTKQRDTDRPMSLSPKEPVYQDSEKLTNHIDPPGSCPDLWARST